MQFVGSNPAGSKFSVGIQTPSAANLHKMFIIRWKAFRKQKSAQLKVIVTLK